MISHDFPVNFPQLPGPTRMARLGEVALLGAHAHLGAAAGGAAGARDDAWGADAHAAGTKAFRKKGWRWDEKYLSYIYI